MKFKDVEKLEAVPQYKFKVAQITVLMSGHLENKSEKSELYTVFERQLADENAQEVYYNWKISMMAEK